MSGKRKYSDQQRLEAVLDVLEKGLSLCEVARRLGTDHKNVRRWVAFYEQYGAKGIDSIKKKVTLNYLLSALCVKIIYLCSRQQ
jgi:transposase-like protein